MKKERRWTTPANAAIYLPTDQVHLHGLFPDVSSDRTGGRRPTFFAFEIGGAEVRLNVMRVEDVANHLSGFQGWVTSLQEPPDRKLSATRLIQRSRCVLGLVTQAEFEADGALWDAIASIARHNHGFVFALNSIYLPDGTVLVGAMREPDA